MYTWKDSLAEHWPYGLVLCFYGILISFLSSFFERIVDKTELSYWSVFGNNVLASIMGVLVISILWIMTGLIKEDLRILISPIISFLVTYLFKFYLANKIGSEKAWLSALVHPFVFSILPVRFIAFIFTLGRGWKN